MFLLFFVACKQEPHSEASGELAVLEKAVEESPNGENISNLLAAYNASIRNPETSRKELKHILEKACKVTIDQGWDKELVGFSSTFLKEFPAEPGNEDRIFRLIGLMEARNQLVAAQTLRYGFLEAFPESPHADSVRVKIDTTVTDTEKFIEQLANRVFVDAAEVGLNPLFSREYVNACEAFVLVLPSRANAPRYLFNAAEVSRTLKTFDKTLYLYDWIIEKYPKYEKAPTALFLKGFILENELNNKEKAIETYREFLQKYPSNELADDVQFLLDNIGKSNEEILEMIEKKQGDK